MDTKGRFKIGYLGVRHDTKYAGKGSSGQKKAYRDLCVGGFIGILLIYTLYVGITIWNYAQRTANIPSDATIVLGVLYGKEAIPVFRDALIMRYGCITGST